MTTDQQPEPENPEVKEGDVAESPTSPAEDGSEPEGDQREDSSATAPVDADEGDPSVNDYPAESI